MICSNLSSEGNQGPEGGGEDCPSPLSAMKVHCIHLCLPSQMQNNLQIQHYNKDYLAMELYIGCFKTQSVFSLLLSALTMKGGFIIIAGASKQAFLASKSSRQHT